MNPNPAETSAANSVTSGDQQVLKTLATHQRRLKWLTIVAVTFWALAVIGTVAVLVGYSLFVAPKEQQILSDYGTHGRLLTDRSELPGRTEPPTSTDKAVGVNFSMTYVVTKGLLVVAFSVVILSCGTLATLILVVFNRRVTLRQINYSLAQISAQLKELQTGKAG